MSKLFHLGDSNFSILNGRCNYSLFFIVDKNEFVDILCWSKSFSLTLNARLSNINSNWSSILDPAYSGNVISILVRARSLMGLIVAV